MPAPALSIRQATRYVLPLREGGSLPAVVETDGADLVVVKFRGAGQGARALVVEIIVGELARTIGLPVPEIALVTVDASFDPNADAVDPALAAASCGSTPSSAASTARRATRT